MSENSKMEDKVWLVGPCSMEDKEMYINTAKELAVILKGKNWYYKGSFDKANRSSAEGKRGPGLEQAKEYWTEVKKAVPGIKLITDVHETHQVKELADFIDCIQIPAFLCRQTDLLVECGKYFDEVNVKKGQWVDPRNMVYAVNKVRKHNPNAKVWACDRGTFFGYEHLTMDFGNVKLLSEHFDRVIIDATHSTQGVNHEGHIVGDRELAKKYLIASTIFGYSGIFAETHPQPETGITDSTCMIYLDHMKKLVEMHDAVEKAYHEAAK